MTPIKKSTDVQNVSRVSAFILIIVKDTTFSEFFSVFD